MLAQVAAGLLSRGVGDAGVATVAGLLSVAAGAAAATVATAGTRDVARTSAPRSCCSARPPPPCFATTAALVIGTRRVPFAAIITGSLLLCIALACCVLFDLPRGRLAPPSSPGSPWR